MKIQIGNKIQKLQSAFKWLTILLFSFVTSAQRITTAIDSTEIKIGSQFNLIIKASVNEKDKVVFPNSKNFGY